MQIDELVRNHVNLAVGVANLLVVEKSSHHFVSATHRHIVTRVDWGENPDVCDIGSNCDRQHRQRRVKPYPSDIYAVGIEQLRYPVHERAFAPWTTCRGGFVAVFDAKTKYELRIFGELAVAHSLRIGNVFADNPRISRRKPCHRIPPLQYGI